MVTDKTESPDTKPLAEYEEEDPLYLSPCNQDHPAGSDGLRVRNFVIPERYSWEDSGENSWELLADLHVELRECCECRRALAIFPLAFEEYGEGSTWHTAIFDLLTSLSDYHELLLDFEESLAPSAEEDLAMLRRMFRARSAD